MRNNVCQNDVNCKGHGGKLLYGVAVALLTVHALMLGWGAIRHSPTWDEVAYLPAGISHWQFGTFELYYYNPPLVRMVAATPVLAAQPRTDWTDLSAGGGWSSWHVGYAFLRANGERSFWLFTLARWACIPFSLLGGYICFRWAQELYGGLAGIMALVLWCFSPNILAHGQMITPDAGTTALGVAAGYTFWHWLKQPTWKRTLVAGLVLGLAELTKMLWVVLFGLWPLLWLVWRWSERDNMSWLLWRQQAARLFFMLVLAVYVINLGYGFEGSFRKLGDYPVLRDVLWAPSHLAHEASGDLNPGVGTWLNEIPVPFPENYLRGLGIHKQYWSHPQESYLRGEWRRGGWWYYYLYGLAVKMPLGTWILMAMALVATMCLQGYRASWRDELFLMAPVVLVVVLLCLRSDVSRHVRYVLPILPFAFIWVAKLARAMDMNGWKVTSLATIAVFWSVTSSLWIYPHSLSYFNELTGGPTGGADHLASSNIDWGQDLLYLKRWMDGHKEASPMAIAFDGGYDPGSVGINCPVPPAGPEGASQELLQKPDELGPKPGWYAISVNIMRWNNRKYAYFLHFEPVDMIGYSMAIYHITNAEANRVRRELGLPALPLRKTDVDSRVERVEQPHTGTITTTPTT